MVIDKKEIYASVISEIYNFIFLDEKINKSERVYSLFV